MAHEFPTVVIEDGQSPRVRALLRQAVRELGEAAPLRFVARAREEHHALLTEPGKRRVTLCFNGHGPFLSSGNLRPDELRLVTAFATRLRDLMGKNGNGDANAVAKP